MFSLPRKVRLERAELRTRQQVGDVARTQRDPSVQGPRPPVLLRHQVHFHVSNVRGAFSCIIIAVLSVGILFYLHRNLEMGVLANPM